MKVAHLNYSDTYGGAARAAYRIHRAVLEADVDSWMLVSDSSSGDWSVSAPDNRPEKMINMLRRSAANFAKRFSTTGSPIIHSPSLMRSCWPKRLNASDFDLVHLHWVGMEMVSVADIARIRRPVIWTLHDMWAFCGAEHYSDDSRWKLGYYANNRPATDSGIDINRWTWERKRKHWKTPMRIVTPSRWLADCVTESAIMQGWPVSVIANPIDIHKWRPIEKTLSREMLDLPSDVPLLAYGAMGGTADPRKGYDLLADALSLLGDYDSANGLEIVIFGEAPPREPPKNRFPVHYVGHLQDDISLRAVYSAADMLLIPSRKDNLPNTGVEALSCGTPVVAFDTSGLPDIVDHKVNGYLARSMDTQDFAEGILWILSSDKNLRGNARKFAVDNFSYEVTAPKYLQIYENM